MNEKADPIPKPVILAEGVSSGSFLKQAGGRALRNTAGRIKTGYIPASASIFAALTGILVLIGWEFDLYFFKSFIDGFTTMKPNTAVSLILCSSSLWLLHRSGGLSSKIKTVAGNLVVVPVTVISAITLCQYFFYWNSGIDGIFFPSKVAQELTSWPGRISPVTATNLLLLSISLLTLGFKTKRGSRPSQWIAIFVAALSLASIIGYAYDVHSLYELGPFSTIALHTAMTCFVLAIGILFMHTEDGPVAVLIKNSLGGLLARGLLPAALILPFGLGWLRLKGQQAGLYGTEFGLALFVTANILVFTILIWRAAILLDKIDRERRQAKEKSQTSLKELDDIKYALDESAIIMITDQAGVITYVNDKFCDISGYGREEVIGQNSAKINSAQHSEKFINTIWATITAGQVWRGELKNVAKDGSLYWVDTTVVPFLDDNRLPYQYVTIRTDITQRKNAEEQFARMAAIVQSSDDAIISANRIGQLLSWNAGAEKMFGYTADEIIGRDASILMPEELKYQLRHILDQLDTQVGSNNSVTERIKKDGTRITVSVTTSPIKNSDGEITGVSAIARDITEKIRAEAALHKSNAQMETIVENLDEGVVVSDLDGTLLHFNRAALDIHSYRGQSELRQLSDLPETFELRELDGKPIDPQQWPLARVLRGEKLNDIEVIVHHKQLRWEKILNYGGAVVPDAEGNPLMAVITIRDITAGKNAEHVLRESETRYRLLFDNNPFPMWVYDLETLGFLAVNDAAIFYYGYSAAEFMSMTIKDIRPPEDIPALLENVAQTRDQIDFADIWQHRKKDGTLIDVEITSHELLFDGRPSRLVLANDVTERKRAERLLQESQTQFRELTESLPQLVWTCRGEDGSCDYLSPQWVTYTGKPAEAQLGFGWAEQIYPDDKNATIESWDRAVAACSIFDTEFRLRRFDGAYRWFKVRAVPFKNNNGAVVKWIGTNTDIEESKQAAKEILQLNENLEQRVEHRTLELQAANKELEAFSYSVSHDLRAPLRAIDGFSAALLEDYNERLDAQGRNYLDRVRAGSQRMANLIDDMLKLSRVTRFEIHRENVDLSKLANDVAGRLREGHNNGSVKVTIEEGLKIFSDERLVRIVLENLLGNAFKFSAKADGAKISFGQNEGPGKSEFFVRDNGAGFDMQYADKLFGAFQRLHSTQEFEGTGIGLATVQRIINRLGGDIRAESEVGEGAAFYFTL